MTSNFLVITLGHGPKAELVADWTVCLYYRLKGVLEQMDRGVVDLQELRRNIELAAAMLDTVYTDETRWAGGDWRISWLTTEHICRPRCCWQVFLSVTKASVGHRGRAQRPAGGIGAKRGARLAGVHLQPEDGRGEASPRGEAEIQEHCPRSASWDICRKVMETVLFIYWEWKYNTFMGKTREGPKQMDGVWPKKYIMGYVKNRSIDKEQSVTRKYAFLKLHSISLLTEKTLTK